MNETSTQDPVCLTICIIPKSGPVIRRCPSRDSMYSLYLEFISYLNPFFRFQNGLVVWIQLELALGCCWSSRSFSPESLLYGSGAIH